MKFMHLGNLFTNYYFSLCGWKPRICTIMPNFRFNRKPTSYVAAADVRFVIVGETSLRATGSEVVARSELIELLV